MKAGAIVWACIIFLEIDVTLAEELLFQHDKFLADPGMNVLDFHDGAVLPSQHDGDPVTQLLAHGADGPGMTLRQFEKKSMLPRAAPRIAANPEDGSKSSLDLEDLDRCPSYQSDDSYYHSELQRAVRTNLISPYAAAWGSIRGFYPEIDLMGDVAAVCSFKTQRSVEHAGPGMSLQQFQDAAARNDAAQRCLNGDTEAQCQEELQYALSNAILSFFAADWGRREGFYPVIDRRDDIQSVCRCGCFEENTRILVKREEGPSEVAVKALTKGDRAVVLGPEATLTELTYEDKPLKSLVKGSEERELYVFRMEDGRSLKLTQHHGAVLADGRVIAASEVRAGDAFLAYETGAPVTVAAVDRETTPGLVYNFEVDAQNDLGHIVVAEGLLVGDLVWQNQKARELGSIVIRQ